MKCQNPNGCAKRYAQWKKWQEKQVPVGEEIHEKLIKEMEEQGKALPESRHARKRELLRAISSQEVRQAVKNGFVIEHTNYRTLHILYHFKIGMKRYRPVHIVLGCEENIWKVVTLYDPRSKSWKWDQSFQERVCFCK